MPGLLILFAAGLLIAWASVVTYTAWMLTHPPRRTYAAAVARGRPGDPSELTPARRFETWTFRSRGLEFPVWEVEGDEPAGPVMILTHGWADSRVGGVARVNALAAAASRLILWDLAGHGEAPGICRLGTAEIGDLTALVEVLRDSERRGGTASSIILYGWSLGAGVSIVVAARSPERIGGVVAESPYCLPATPARNVLRLRSLPYRLTLAPALWLVGFLTGASPGFRTPPAPSPRSTASGVHPPRRAPSAFSRSGSEGALTIFDRAAHAARLACPLLVLHGSDDEVCPVEDGRAIAAAAPRATLAEIPGARHNDLWTEPRHAERAGAAVQSFVRKLQPGGPCGVV